MKLSTCGSVALVAMLSNCAVADGPWGAALSLVTVENGAPFDWAGAFTKTGSAYNFAVAEPTGDSH